jgi:hypothetical protein
VILPGSRSEASRLEIPSLPTAKAVGYYLTPPPGLDAGEGPIRLRSGQVRATQPQRRLSLE